VVARASGDGAGERWRRGAGGGGAVCGGEQAARVRTTRAGARMAQIRLTGGRGCGGGARAAAAQNGSGEIEKTAEDERFYEGVRSARHVMTGRGGRYDRTRWCSVRSYSSKLLE
jgi:hypothetical protein